MKGKWTMRLMGGVLGCLLFLVVLFWEAIAAQVTGAIFTTDATGSFVNANVYNDKEDVYLNGGPRPNAPCTAAGLPDGEYYFQVTDPSGSALLSSDDIENRRVRVSDGVIVAYLGGTHVTGAGQCGDITVQLFHYNDTPNPGAEYKVWMTPVGDYSQTGLGTFGFLSSKSKTDNFKVHPPADADGDGIPDDQDICPDDPDPMCAGY